MKKIFILASLMFCNLTIGFSQNIDVSNTDIYLEKLDLEQGGIIQLTSDYIIPVDVDAKFVDSGHTRIYFDSVSSKFRVIKSGTVLRIAEVRRDSDTRWIYIYSEDQKIGITKFECYSCSAKKFTDKFKGKFKLLGPDPDYVASGIEMPNGSKSKIDAKEVVQILPQACVYIGMWKERDQLPNLSKNAKEYLETLIPILRGTFKSLNNIDCESIPKEKLVEAAIKLSEDKNINDNKRNSPKPKKDSNHKTKGHSSKNM